MKPNPLEVSILSRTQGRSIKEYQLEKIQETLRLVSANSPYYKSKYQGYDIGAIKSLEDFGKLPFMSAEDLTLFGPKMLCVPQNEIERIVTLQTSGTVGEPKRLYFTAADQELAIEFFHVGIGCLVDQKDNFMILLPYKIPGMVGDLLEKGLKRFGCGVYPYGLIESYQDAAEFMLENNITSLVGNPVQVLKLAEFTKLRGMNLKLTSVLLATDYVPDVIAQRVAALWQCQAFEHYAMTEMYYGGGVYCEHLAGYHVFEADLYFEIISDQGQSLPDGEYGEIVFTTLTRNGMPLIRYRTGDYGRFKNERCDCSSKLRLMDKVRRRVAGGTVIGGREFYMSDFDEMFFSCDKVVDYKLAVNNGELNVKIMTVDDIAEQDASPERLTKRKIISGGENETDD
jgi:Coenzyme F390 synthetase